MTIESGSLLSPQVQELIFYLRETDPPEELIPWKTAFDLGWRLPAEQRLAIEFFTPRQKKDESIRNIFVLRDNVWRQLTRIRI